MGLHGRNTYTWARVSQPHITVTLQISWNRHKMLQHRLAKAINALEGHSQTPNWQEPWQGPSLQLYESCGVHPSPGALATLMTGLQLKNPNEDISREPIIVYTKNWVDRVNFTCLLVYYTKQSLKYCYSPEVILCMTASLDTWVVFRLWT